MEVDLWYMPVQRPYNPNAKRMAEMMQADLAKIGVNAKLVTYEWGEYRKRLQQGEHITGMLGWNGDNGDPDNFFFLHSCDAARPGGQNLSKWCNKSFEWGEYRKRMQAGEHQTGMLGWTGDNGDPDNFLANLLGCDSAKSNGSNVAKFCYQPYEDLIQKAKSATSQAERQKLYEQAQVIFKQQAPWFTIAHAVQLKPVRKEVIDFKLSPFGRHTFYGVDIKE